MKKLKNSKGITLVSLTVTVIVLLILAGIAIAQVTENGLFVNTKLAKEKYEISEAKEKLEFAITELRIEQEGKGESLKKEDLIKLHNEELEAKSTENFPVEIVYKEYVFNVDEKFAVTYVGKASGTVVTYTTEPEGYIKEGSVLIKINISNSNGISKIQNPKGVENNCNGKTSVGIDYSVTSNGIYTFKIIDTKGNETLKDIIIDNFDTEDAIVENQEIGASTSYKLKVKAKDELSGLKRITVETTIKNDSGTTTNNKKTVYLSGEYQKEEEIDLGLNYNYTLTAYTIEVEDQVGNVKTYDSTVELPITNTIYRISTIDPNSLTRQDGKVFLILEGVENQVPWELYNQDGNTASVSNEVGYLKYGGGDPYTFSNYHVAHKVDLTNVNKIVLDTAANYIGGGVDSFFVSTSNKTTGYDTQGNTSGIVAYEKVTSATRTTYELDVSGINGDYYIGMIDSYYSFYVYNFYLEMAQ